MSYGYGYEQRPSLGIDLRVLIGIVIALVGIVGYFLKTEVNPVTGEKQRVALNVEEEKALGLQAAPQMAEKMGGTVDPRGDGRARMVQQVGRRLVAQTEAGRSPYADNFHFNLLDDPKTVNAFALPGGQVFITEGLFNRLDNEAQLAGVLGHEIGHVINRHTAQQMAKGQLGQSLTLAVGVGASGRERGGRTAAMAAMLANNMMQLRYGREDESQSDRYGMRLMYQAGYDPAAMLDVMRILKEAAGGSRQPEFLSSHPLPETRLEEIGEILDAQYPPESRRGLTLGRSFRRSSAGRWPIGSGAPRGLLTVDLR